MNHIVVKKTKRNAKAFTLLETVLSLAVGSILLMSLGSAVIIMSKAVPQTASASSIRNKSTRQIYNIARNIQTAKEVIKAERYTFIFEVDDRNGDGSDDTIQYAFNTAENTLGISFNGSAIKIIEEDLYNFTFDYNTISNKDITVKITDLKISHQKSAHTSTMMMRNVRMINRPKVR